MATNKTTHCLFRDCARFVHALGLCLPHYKRHLLGEDLGDIHEAQETRRKYTSALHNPDTDAALEIVQVEVVVPE